MVNQTVTDTERNKQLRRIADSLEKIAKYLGKLDPNKLTIKYEINNNGK